MTIKATYQALKTVANTVLPTFTFYGMYKSRYNSVKQISDNTIIIEPPRQWPANFRNTCQARFTTKVWLLIRESIKPETGGTEQYPPFAEIDIRDTLVTAALTLINGINSHSAMSVVGEFNGLSDLITLTDAVDGTTTNVQSAAYFTLTIDSYGSNGLYVPQVYAPGMTYTTQLRITNGDTLPTGVSPDILFIDTGQVNGDYSVDPLVIVKPDGYVFKKCYLDAGNAELVDFVIKDSEGIITQEGSFTGQRVIYQITENAVINGNFEITCVNNTSDYWRAVLKFEKSML